MKIGQYKCSLSGDSYKDTLGVVIDDITTLAPGLEYSYDVLIWNNCEPFGAEQLEHFPRLKTFINWGTDDDNIDKSLLAAHDITIKKVDFYATETLAEYIVSIMLLFERQHVRLLAGEKVTGNELYRKKVGIIGLGKIGYRTTMMLQQAFACQIYYYSESDKHIPNCIFAPLEALFASCDYIIIATKSGTLSIDITAMPVIHPGLVVVNISRDSVLPLESMLPLLRSNGLRGFIGDLSLDKKDFEALPENVLILPHRGYMTHVSSEIKRNILLFYLRKIAASAPQIHVVRHGETEWNKEGKLQGSMDSPLSSAGRKHAKDIASSLVDSKVTLVFTSPLARARTTARIIANKIGAQLVVIPEFAEMSFGIFEGKPRKQIEELFADFFEDRNANQYIKLFTPYPNGESYYDVYLRVLRPLMQILSEGTPCIIVGHESVNRMLRGITTEKSLAEMVHARQKNNQVVLVDANSGDEVITTV